MIKKRRRFRQTATLAERLKDEASRLRELARLLPPGPELLQLSRKLQQTESALWLDAWLTSPDGRPPQRPSGLMTGNRNRRAGAAGQSTQSGSA